MQPKREPKVASTTINESGEEEEEVDEWDKRIQDTGCAKENEKLQDCFYETKDWRKCQDEMKAFRACWSQKEKKEKS